MSGYQRPPGIATTLLRLPRVARTGADNPINQAFTLLEQADTQNLKRGQEIALPSLLLTASDGSTWRVTIAGDGQLTASQVPRP